MIFQRDIIHPNERKYFVLAVILSIIIYVSLALSIIGIIYLLLFGVLSLIFHSLMLASIRINAVKLSPSQFEPIFQRVRQLCDKMDIPLVPDIYVLQSGGLLNAFAAKFFKRNMVVLYSEVFELIEMNAEDELLFIIAHELAHIKRRHLTKQLLILPAMWVPFFSEAYSRACEYTCDRFAAHYLGNHMAAKNCLTILAVGKTLYNKVNQREFIDQINNERGFFTWLIQSLSTHPPLPKRIQEICFLESGEYSWSQATGSKRWILVTFIILSILAATGYGAKTALTFIDNQGISNFFSSQKTLANEDNDLINAVVANDLTTLVSLINQGKNLEQVDAEGMTALDWAIEDNNLDAVTILVKAGADVNHLDFYRVSPLMRATNLGSIEIMNLLLSNGSNLNEQDQDGDTPLMYAVFNQNIDSIKLLLEHGADKEIKNNENYTALMYAIRYNNQEITNLLRVKIDLPSLLP